MRLGLGRSSVASLGARRSTLQAGGSVRALRVSGPNPVSAALRSSPCWYKGSAGSSNLRLPRSPRVFELAPLLATALCIGIAAGDHGAIGVVAAEIVLVQALALGLVLRVPRARLLCAGIAVAAAGALGMAERREAARWTSAASRIEATVEGRVASSTARSDAVSVVVGSIRRTDGGAEPVPGRIRLRVEHGSALAMSVPGDGVRARVRLRPLVSRFDPGTADPAERLRRAGIGATGGLAHPALAVRAARGTRLRARAALRARRGAAAEALERSGAGLAGALALGTRQAMRPGDEAALRAAGLSHLLAVSGLNLAMVAALAFAGVRRALLRAAPQAVLDPRRTALAAAICAAVGYAALTGFEVSVQRALAFLSVGCAALWLRRPVSALQLVGTAALAILAREPAALFDPGAQLSFAAAAALLLARGPAEPGAAPASARGRAHAWLAAAVGVSAAALAATAPIVAVHFGRLSPAALLANLVAVPLTELVLLPASLAAALAALAAPEAAWLAAPAAWVVRIGGEALATVARTATAGPGAELVVGVSAAGIVVASLAGAAALRARAPALRVAFLLTGQAVLVLAPAPRFLPEAPRLVAFDVGQGDSVLVQGRRAALLVDAGTALSDGVDLGRTVVVPALAVLGVRRLDVVAASHADLDHRGGLVAVLETVRVGALWLPHGGRADPGFASLVAAAARRGVPVEEHGTGDAMRRVGDLAIEPLWPPRGGAAVRGLGDNDRSLALRVEVAGTRVLLTGDLEERAERALLARHALDAEVLKLGHHGSRTSSTAAFLAAVGPEIAVASAPCLGRFAMPHTEVRRRLETERASLWWTGRDGATFVGLERPRVAVGLARARVAGERWTCGG